jgi:hypothetical protein
MSDDFPTFAETGEENIRDLHGSLRNLMFLKMAEIRAGPHTVRDGENHD